VNADNPVNDLRKRLRHPQSALRNEPLTEGTQPTADGHIRSAITKLERRLEALLLQANTRGQ
jgi:hypothetical protein